jgi:hypothetical protein
MTRVLTPCGHLLRALLPYSGPIAGETLRQGTPMASGDGQPCETPPKHSMAFQRMLRGGNSACRGKYGHGHSANIKEWPRDGSKLLCFAQGKVILAASTFRR